MSEDGKAVTPYVTDEVRNQLEALRKEWAGKRRMVAEMKANVSAFMPGTIENWPRNIQDQVYAALEKTSLGRGYNIQISYCDENHDDGGWFVHVIATGTMQVQ